MYVHSVVSTLTARAALTAYKLDVVYRFRLLNVSHTATNMPIWFGLPSAITRALNDSLHFVPPLRDGLADLGTKTVGTFLGPFGSLVFSLFRDFSAAAQELPAFRCKCADGA
jgi:hypothetical protein